MLVEYGNHLLELCFVMEYAIAANLIDFLLTFKQGFQNECVALPCSVPSQGDVDVP